MNGLLAMRPDVEAFARATIEQADAQNVKRGQDVEIAGGAASILTDTVTGARSR